MGRFCPKPGLRVLIVSPWVADRAALISASSQPVWAADLAAAERVIAVQAFDVLWLDLTVIQADGLRRLLSFCPAARVVLLASSPGPTPDWASDIANQVVAVVHRPFSRIELELAMQAVAAARCADRRGRANGRHWFDLPTASPEQRQAMALARRVAPTNTPVLILGERGTGKSRLAEHLHGWSDRSSEPFEVLHCASASADAVEDHWFGQSAEAGSGQPPDIAGRLDACHGATLLLNEVAALPSAVQLKFERLLTHGQYERRDDFTVRSTNLRLIATSSIDLQQAVDAGKFRRELLAALDVVRVELPPLRSRPADIVPLAESYLTGCSPDQDGQRFTLAPDLVAAMRQYGWPGNQRELFNLIDRAVLLCSGNLLELRHFPLNLANGSPAPAAVHLRHPPYVPGDLVSLEAIEDLHVRSVVAATSTIKEAATVLGINYSTLWRRLRKQPGGTALRMPPLKSNREAM